MGKKRKAARPVKHASGKPAVAATLDRWLEQAVSAQANGAPGEARTYFRKIVNKDPARAPVWHALAGACYELGDLGEAAEALERACEYEPANVDYLNDLGGLYLSMNALEPAERILKNVVSVDPEYGQAQYNLASVLYQRGKVPDAVAELNRLLQREPGFAEAHFNLGIALRDLGQLAGALDAFGRARKLQPENARAGLEMARLEADAHMADAAIGHYRRYLERVPGDVDVACELAELLHRDGQTDAAIDLLEDANRTAESPAKIGLTLAGILHNAGRLDEAESTYLDVLGKSPQAASAAVGLSRIRRFSDADDPVLTRLTASIADPELTPEQTEPLHFALGKIHDDLGSHAAAFEHYAIGNATHARSVNYDRKAAEAECDQLIDVFRPEVLAAGAEHTSEAVKPILIVGMPRSGTTLTEQIIAAHADAAGAGELAFFPALALQLPALAGTGSTYPTCFREAGSELCHQIIGHYIGLLERHGPDASRVTDKMPVNYKHVGLALSLFPRAHVIVCRRDPRDVALSIYFQYFRERHDYAWAMPDIAHCYVQHERLVRHWIACDTGAVHEVSYADLITDHERTARALIDFVGLGWDPNCLEFHKLARDVKTASNWQVRQPIYRSSLERWRAYEPFLDEFVDHLENERSRYGLADPRA